MPAGRPSKYSDILDEPPCFIRERYTRKAIQACIDAGMDMNRRIDVEYDPIRSVMKMSQERLAPKTDG